MASGGVMIYRPLLPFPKERLTATCEAARVHWYQDATNSDKTLTVRNTVRYLLGQERLPKAICKPNLLRISALTQTALSKSHEEAMRMLRALRIISFDPRSGVLVFQQPAEANAGYDRPHLLRVATSILSKLASAVSPNEHISSSSLASVARYVFLDQSKARAEQSSGVTLTLTAASVVWQRTLSLTGADFNSSPIWTLSRQPYMSVKLQPSCTWSSELARPSTKACPYWTWQLFDGRVWIRVKSSDCRLIIVRPFHQTDLSRLRRILPHAQKKKVEEQLAECAPGKVRWTLPLLVDATTAALLALPTLALRLFPAGKSLQWQIQYKHLDLDQFDSRHLKQ